MAAAQATPEEIGVWFSEELEAEETTRANLLLTTAYNFIIGKLGRESLFNEACKGIQLQMVVRVWNNQNLLGQGGVGPENGTFPLGQYGLYFTFAEEALLDGIKKKIGFQTITTVRNDRQYWF